MLYLPALTTAGLQCLFRGASVRQACKSTRVDVSQARAQVEAADVVLVNKIDCIPPGELPRLLAVLGALNPGAPLIPTEHGHVAPGALMGARRFNAEAAAERPGWLRAINARAEARVEGPSTSGHAHAHSRQHSEAEKYGVSTFVYHARRCARLSECSCRCYTARSGIEAPNVVRRGPAPVSERRGSNYDASAECSETAGAACRPFHPGRLLAALEQPWPGVLRSKGLFWLATRHDVAGLWQSAGGAWRGDPGCGPGSPGPCLHVLEWPWSLESL